MSVDSNTSRFGSELRRLRQAAGLSQELLAERSGLSVDAIAALERGRRRHPRLATIRLLADALGVPRDRLSNVLDTSPIQPTTRPPIPPDQLIGREADCAAVLAETETPGVRLVSLVGPGGVGKTRLATAAAHTLSGRRQNVCWIPLSGVSTAASAYRGLLMALGGRENPDQDPIADIAERLGDDRTFLVLDNCEHLVGDIATACARLLSACRELRIIVTSRERLNVAGESVYDVRPLAAPARTGSAEAMARSPAVQLFVARARSQPVGRRPGSDALPAIAEICRRLGGLPLGIELAAARLNALTPQEIAIALRTTTAILTGGSTWADPDTANRHRSMDAAIGWSVALLSPNERSTLARLSVFAGGWTIDAAGAVCGRTVPGAESGGTRTTAVADIVDVIGRLVDKSLIAVQHRDAERRYSMLTVIQDRAATMLRESGELEHSRRAHAEHFIELADTARPYLSRADAGRIRRLDSELDNIRAAMGWQLDQPDGAGALRLAAALWPFCALRGHYAEGRDWLDTALAATGATERYDVRLRAEAMLGSGTLAFLLCDYPAADRLVTEALVAFTRIHDLTGAARAVQRRGAIARERGRYDEAIDLHRRARAIFRDLDEDLGVALSDNLLALTAWLRGDFGDAERAASSALVTFRARTDREGVAWSLINLGVIARYRGDSERAESLLHEGGRISAEIGFREGVAWSLNQRGAVRRQRGEIAAARELLTDSLDRHRDLGDRWRMASVLEELAAVSAAGGDALAAAEQLAAARRLRERIGAPVPPVERPDYEGTVRSVTDILGTAAVAASWTGFSTVLGDDDQPMGEEEPPPAPGVAVPARPSRPGPPSPLVGL
ncbi:MAG: ATP-binding protein [Mycobacteriales bacterium]